MTTQDRSGYNRAFARLIQRVRALEQTEREWSPTPKRKRIEEVAAKLDELATYLEGHGSDQFDIEEEHNRQPAPEVGPDGWPRAVERPWPSYKATVWHMRDLAASARRVADDLPSPRKKRALPFAALALLHLRYNHGYARPVLSDSSEDVFELKRLCEEAGIVLSDTRLRGALAEAFDSFDPTFCPYYIEDLIG